MTAAALPMFGAWRGTLVGVRPYSVHSDPYYELHLEREGQVWALRTSAHVLPVMPEQACPVEVTFLMGQVTGVKLLQD